MPISASIKGSVWYEGSAIWMGLGNSYEDALNNLSDEDHLYINAENTVLLVVAYCGNHTNQCSLYLESKIDTLKDDCFMCI